MADPKGNPRCKKGRRKPAALFCVSNLSLDDYHCPQARLM
jgi:hypothetical protein